MTADRRFRTVAGMTTTTVPEALDEQAVQAFAGELMGLFTGGLLTYMIDIGHRTGLLGALAEGRATSDGLATRAGLHERYVREWLGAMATGGIVDYEAPTHTFSLPAERSVCLAGHGAMNLAPLSQLNTHLAKHVEVVARAFREGGGGTSHLMWCSCSTRSMTRSTPLACSAGSTPRSLPVASL